VEKLETGVQAMALDCRGHSMRGRRLVRDPRRRDRPVGGRFALAVPRFDKREYKAHAALR